MKGERVPTCDARIGGSATYRRSAEFREEGTGIYDRVYAAERPELFFKATASRCVGPGEPIGRRRDSSFTAAEPELAVVLGSSGRILGYTLATHEPGVSTLQAQTTAVMTLTWVGLLVLSIVAAPLNRWRLALVWAMGAGAVAAFVLPVTQTFFALDPKRSPLSASSERSPRFSPSQWLMKIFLPAWRISAQRWSQGRMCCSNHLPLRLLG